MFSLIKKNCGFKIGENDYKIVLNTGSKKQLSGLLQYQYQDAIFIYKKGNTFFVHVVENRYELKKKYLDIGISISCSIIFCNENILSFHSASVVLNNKANLFIGESGYGKSTLADIAKKKNLVLNDEISCVYLPVKNAASLVFSGPYWSKEYYSATIHDKYSWSNKKRYHLRSIYFLNKDWKNKTWIKEISCCDSAAHLLKSFFNARFNHQLPLECKKKIFFQITRLVNVIPVFDLNINLKHHFLDYIQSNPVKTKSRTVNINNFESKNYLISEFDDYSLIFRLNDFNLFKINSHYVNLIKAIIKKQKNIKKIAGEISVKTQKNTDIIIKEAKKIWQKVKI